MAWFEAQTISEIHDAVIAASLQDSRDLLIASLPEEYSAKLPKRNNSRDQLLSDLQEMNKIEQPVAGGLVPFVEWLNGAIHHTKVHPDREEFFSSKLDELKRKMSDAHGAPGNDTAQKNHDSLTDSDSKAPNGVMRYRTPALILLIVFLAVLALFLFLRPCMSSADIEALDAIGVSVDIKNHPTTIGMAKTTLSERQLEKLSSCLVRARCPLHLSIDGCAMTDLGFLNKTNTVRIDATNNLKMSSLWSHGQISGLQYLNLRKNPALLSLSNCSGIESLKLIDATSSGVLRLSDISDLDNLERLTLDQCGDLELSQPATTVKWVPSMPQLQEASFVACRSISDLGWLKNAPNLKKLALNGCTSLSSLKSLPLLEKLEVLTLQESLRPKRVLGIERGISNPEEVGDRFEQAMENLQSFPCLQEVYFDQGFVPKDANLDQYQFNVLTMRYSRN